MLASLTDAGYLLRHPADKTYSLGPAVIALGSSAVRQFLPVDYATDEMRGLADELGVQCVAGAVVGGEIVFLAKAGHPKPLGTNIAPGQRLPLAPPLGTVYMAWALPEEIDAWLAKLGPDVTAEQKGHFVEALDLVRRRGYATGLEAIAKLRLSRALAGAQAGGDDLQRQRLRDIVEGLVDELAHEESVLSGLTSSEFDAARSFQVSHISAPVFDAEARVAMALNLIDLPRRLTGEQIETHAGRLVESTRRVTKAIGGREPELKEST